MKIDTLLVNVPIRSPLHPKANLPFLKGYLGQHGYKIKAVDSNISFFRWFLDHETCGVKDPAYGMSGALGRMSKAPHG